MNTTVYELKQYYVAAGGQAADVENISTIPEMIAAITALGGAGGGVTVVGIHFSQTGTPTLDVTAEELIALLEKGDVWYNMNGYRNRFVSWTDNTYEESFKYAFLAVGIYLNGDQKGTFNLWKCANATDNPTM